MGTTIFQEYFDVTDPNTITFSISVTNQYVNTTTVPVQLEIAGGVPSYIAVLVNDHQRDLAGVHHHQPLGTNPNQRGLYRLSGPAWLGPDSHRDLADRAAVPRHHTTGADIDEPSDPERFPTVH